MFWIILLIFSFVSGQILSFSFNNGVRVSALDIMVVIFLFRFMVQSRLRVASVKLYLRLFWLFAAICIISLISQIGKLSIGQIGISSLYLVRFMAYASLLPIFILDKRLHKLGLNGLWWGGTVIALLGLVQYFLYPNLRNLSYLGWDPHQYRIFSTLLDANFCGMIIALTIFLGLFLMVNKLINKRIGIILLVVNLIALLLTYSRGSYAAFLVGVIFWWFLDSGNKKLIRKIGEIGIIGGIFILILFLLPKPGGEGVNLLRVMSIESRMENNQEAWSLFISHPVLGVGFDTLRYVRNIDITSHSRAGFHNSYLFILATTGILGFVSYFWLFWKIWEIGKVVRIGEIRRRDGKRLLAVSFIAVFMHSFFDNSLFYPYIMFWLFVLTGSLKEIKGI